MKKDLSALREEYQFSDLDESQVPSSPIALFNKWLDEAIRSQVPEPNAMTLATVTPNNKPAARVLLLKEVDSDGCFLFYTNYNSHKGVELNNNPNAALVFLWLEMQRQVRVGGRTEKVSTATSDAYFAIRPKKSQISAVVSPQSQELSSRTKLEKAFSAMANQAAGKTVERPAHWGGYRLLPETIEFWQGRENRLHDRLLYTHQNDQWEITRLAP